VSFKSLEQRVAPANRKPASIRLAMRKEAQHPACIVSFRAFFGEQLKWKKGESVGVQLGESEDVGKMRIVRGLEPAIAVVRPNTKGGLTFDLGHIAGLNEGAPAGKIAVDARVIDKSTVEIILPDWRDAPEPDGEEDEPAPTPRSPPPQRAVGHAPTKSEPRVTIAGVTIDFTPDNESVKFKGKAMEVTARQAQLIKLLARGMPKPIDRGFLRKHLFGANEVATADLTLDTIAMDLAKAVGAIGLVFKNVKGVGFALQEAGK
jgi:hypothetical protein